MVKVAVAGGTGSLGRTMVEVLRINPKHDVVVLGRTASAGTIAADYSDVDGTAKTLRENDVHTVLCTINVSDAASSEAQLKLIAAAAKSGAVKRFVVSEWGIVHKPTSPYYAFRDASYAALRETSLEWTRVANGYFLDYWGLPRGLPSHMRQMPDFAVDVAHRRAAIPGSGDDVVSFIYTHDAARFVSAWLESPVRWDETTYCYGDRITWNSFLREAEAAVGAKFDVVHDPEDFLARGQITELPSHVSAYAYFPKPSLQGLFALFGSWVIEGVFDFPVDKALNKRFPDLQPMTAKDVLALWKEN